MKNKKLNYLLIILVIIIWGLIIYHIILYLKGDGDEADNFKMPQKKEAYNDYQLPKDTTRLMLNYQDPFGTTSADTIAALHTHLHIIKSKPHALKQSINWDFIKYVGYIKNPGSKQLIAMVHINGKNLMMAEGETAGQVKLLKNFRDSIRVSYDGKTRYILIKSAAL